MKKIGVIGPRSRDSEDDHNKIEKAFFDIYEAGDRIVSGGCPRGGDRFAEAIAKKHQIPITIFYAQWNRLGKSAGYARNSDIVKESDVIVALQPPEESGGTWDSIQKAQVLGKEIVLVP